MDTAESGRERLRSWPVWDRTVRVFHWVNFLCILGLIAVGLIILNSKAFGVSDEGKILLKTVHVYIGYVFAINLGWRLVWAFAGSRFARWKAILPFGRGFGRSLRLYAAGFNQGTPPPYAGHNPPARLMVTFLFLLLISQAATGLVLAGTDLYKPPFGGIFADWVSDPDAGTAVRPGSMEGVDEAAYREMRDFRKPFATLHVYGFYLIVIAIVLHVAGVAVAEFRERSGLVSAMFTGSKVFAEKPVDLDGSDE